ncbi:Protein CBG17611 [Caenorhabditis briggsae]|uniref:Protein CBG17611 n=1 Tax=Caenorhabditis briggsae TaxID=6238 RepID=A8XRQ0_CAEBR|nr:Protein CBG17611 [Caenorhabditis briggsae]CAP35324.1 Protein CBG17611 [Caenorhabditis briggsae]
MSVSHKTLLFFFTVLLLVTIIDAQRFIVRRDAGSNEELNGLLSNSRRYAANGNSPMLKRNSLLDNLYNIGYFQY